MGERAEQLTGPEALHGEGPVWSPSWGGLRYIDMAAGDVLHLRPDGSVSRRHVGSFVAMIRPRDFGGAVVGLERGIALIDGDFDHGEITELPPAWSDPTVRLNEGSCDPQGRLYIGSMAYDERPGAGSLYRFSFDGRASVVLADVTISNGLDWSPDGSIAYYADTPTGRIDAFDYPTTGASMHELTGRRPLIDVDGNPDGLVVDSEGCIWVALWGGSAVHRYRPDGTLDGVVELPVSQVTACTFGGANLDELLITTSARGLPLGAEPEAGAVFGYRPGVRGLPVRPFAA